MIMVSYDGKGLDNASVIVAVVLRNANKVKGLSTGLATECESWPDFVFFPVWLPYRFF